MCFPRLSHAARADPSDRKAGPFWDLDAQGEGTFWMEQHAYGYVTASLSYKEVRPATPLHR